MFTNCLAIQDQMFATRPSACRIAVTTVVGNHVCQPNGPVIKYGPRFWRNNTDGQVSPPSVDLPVDATVRATPKFRVNVAQDHREVIEGFDVVPKFDVISELVTGACQNASARQRRFCRRRRERSDRR